MSSFEEPTTRGSFDFFKASSTTLFTFRLDFAEIIVILCCSSNVDTPDPDSGAIIILTFESAHLVGR